jgi:hypothetical protein
VDLLGKPVEQSPNVEPSPAAKATEPHASLPNSTPTNHNELLFNFSVVFVMF